MRTSIRKINGLAHGEKLDFLSFLTQATSFIVDIAKTIASLAAVGCIFILIRLLPKRIRRFVSAIAALLLFVALYGYAVQQIAFLAIKTTLINFALVNICALTSLFCLYFATNCGYVFARKTRRFGSLLPRQSSTEVFSRKEFIIASTSYLRISPIILQ